MSYFVDAVTKHYADFNGRARRREYWMFMLGNFVCLIVAAILDNILGLTVEDLPYGAIYLLTVFALFVPGFAVTVRRLHDLGKSGWFWLVLFIPLAGAIWFLVLMCRDGQPETNAYGANPKSAGTTPVSAVIPAAFATAGGHTFAAAPMTAPSTEQVKSRFCPSCGAPNTAQGRFCASCGTALP